MCIRDRDKAEQAAQRAISSPLLESTIDGAKGVIISISASEDIEMCIRDSVNIRRSA